MSSGMWGSRGRGLATANTEQKRMEVSPDTWGYVWLNPSPVQEHAAKIRTYTHVLIS